MAKLTDMTKKSFIRNGGKTHLPEWYKYSYIVGIVILIIALLFSYISDDSINEQNIQNNFDNSYINADNNIKIDNTYNDNKPTVTDNFYSINDVDGTENLIPNEAFDVAKKSAEALFTGNWEKVQYYGSIPEGVTTDEKVIIGESTLLDYQEFKSLSIIFDYIRDNKTKNKITVTVYYIDNKWMYSS
jgi:hypothetical protein